ncbi:hypothetical protein NC653_028297 [Populus alba x Populus x berolinensis]|uniref:Uncharacterized protein n=1 Tax=Populus alba x Populus x berolinensis TaxID=444605 RepID=A0AAD6M7L7_9ROSI|nr:hypothetical protein NC653_028297 [Populus alba x Populus x berolinensis]
MKLWLPKSHAFMATPLAFRSIRRACFASSGLKWEGGVSMVQGASRGIGLEFVKQLLEKNDKGHVIATCRNPNGATGLVDLKNKFAERLNIMPLDLTIESTIEASAKFIREKYGSLNLLINASGILSIPNVLQPETTLSKVERSSLMLAYEVNAVGPILAIKHMWPLLKAGGGFGTERDVAVVANLSARVGSIGDNHLGGWHSYRSSKAALNQCMISSAKFPWHAFLDLWLQFIIFNCSLIISTSNEMLHYCMSTFNTFLSATWQGICRGHRCLRFDTIHACEVCLFSLFGPSNAQATDGLCKGHAWCPETQAYPEVFQPMTKTVSVEFARKRDPIICILLHPGTVDTDLSKPFQRNVPDGKLFTKEFSVQQLLSIINNAKSHDNGKFFAWDGQEIPW